MSRYVVEVVAVVAALGLVLVAVVVEVVVAFDLVVVTAIGQPSQTAVYAWLHVPVSVQAATTRQWPSRAALAAVNTT